jgi:hypothetical protein
MGSFNGNLVYSVVIISFFGFCIYLSYNSGKGSYNDYANQKIVLITFFCFYLYLSYNSNKLKRDRNWSSVTCNPLNMVLGSIFDSDNSNKQFEKCMQYSVSSDQEKRIQDYSKDLDKNLQNNINKLSAGELENKNAAQVLLGVTTDKIDKLNNESLDNETTINDFKIKIQNLTDDINNSFDTFKEPGNNLLSKLEIQ